VRLGFVLLVSLLVLAGTLRTAPARADGDPASDVLLYEPAYLPLEQPAPDVSSDLLKVLGETRAAGAPLKVAIIRERRDLGLEGKFFGRPQAYADFLAGELQAFAQLAHRRQLGREPLLVVMPAGFGLHGLPSATKEALARVRVPPVEDADRLTEAAGLGVQALAAQRGHPIEARFPRHAPGGHAWIYALAGGLIALVLAATMVGVARRRRSS
jgi:hypothetical protein